MVTRLGAELMRERIFFRASNYKKTWQLFGEEFSLVHGHVDIVSDEVSCSAWNIAMRSDVIFCKNTIIC